MLGHYMLAIYDENGEWPAMFGDDIAVYDTVREASEATGVGTDYLWGKAMAVLKGKGHRIEIRGQQYTLWVIDTNE